MMTSYSLKAVSTVTLAAPAASITFSGLSGTQFEVDGWVRADAGASPLIQMRFNADSGTNYVRQYINASATSVSGGRATGQSSISAETDMGTAQAASLSAFISKPAASVRAQTTVSVGLRTSPQIELMGGEWNNTSDLITSITILASANNFAANTQVSLFSNAGTGSQQWERITTVVLAAPAASISVTGMSTDYRKWKALLYAVKGTSNGGPDLRINNDSGSNYAHQRLTADATTVAGARATGTAMPIFGNFALQASGGTGIFTIDIAKPVAAEPGRILTSASSISAADGNVIYGARAGEWNNTANLIDRMDILANAGDLAASTRLILAGQVPA